MAVFGEAVDIYQLKNIDSTSCAFLKVALRSGDVLFVKVVNASRADELNKAEEIASWLDNTGVRAMTAVCHARLDDGLGLWAYTYHEGCPPEPNEVDMRAIGAELGRLHESLSGHPRRAQWLRRTDERLSRLAVVRRALAQGHTQAGPEPILLREVAADRSIEFLPGRYGSELARTPLHGDLNRFNMLMDERGCMFLDFEDVVHNVLPPIFDLAGVYERVVLAGRRSAPTEGLLDALLDAYSAVRGWRPETACFTEVRRGLALRSLCILAETDPNGRDELEWRKFFNLLADAQISDKPVLGDNKNL